MDEAESSAASVDALAEAKQQIRAAQKALEIRTLQLVEDRQGGTKFQPWLEKMGWSTYLHGLDRRGILRLPRRPRPHDGRGPDYLSYVTRLVNQCMTRGSQGAMQWIFDRCAYGMKIHYTSTSAGNVEWVGDQIRHKKIDLHMDQLREMVHGLVYRTYQALKLVFSAKETEFPSIP